MASALKLMNSEWREENLKGSSVVELSRGETIWNLLREIFPAQTSSRTWSDLSLNRFS